MIRPMTAPQRTRGSTPSSSASALLAAPVVALLACLSFLVIATPRSR